jgi:hypothetical protein
MPIYFISLLLMLSPVGADFNNLTKFSNLPSLEA